MNFQFDELLYYGGLFTAVAGGLFSLFYFVLSRAAISRLKKKMIEEYGERRK